MDSCAGRGAVWLTCVLILPGCAPAPVAGRYSVEEYRADRALREARLKACADDPGTLRDMPDCVNAQRAASLEGRGSLRSSGSMGLDPAPSQPR
jgi:hypothetical protein